MSSERGSVLAMMFFIVTLILLMGMGLAKIVLGRKTLSARAETSAQARLLGQSAQHIAYACLDGSGFGSATCDATPAQQACFPAAIAGHAVTIALSGSPPDCRMTVKVAE